MKGESEKYLERELAFLGSAQGELARYFAQQYPAEAGFASTFARHYPERAGQLVLDAQQTPDPHAERMIQGFAFLAGRIHHKVDEEFPQLTEVLLGILYPHMLLPTPSMSMAQFTPDLAGASTTWPVQVPRHTALASRPVGHPPRPCLWQTGYPVELWPVQVRQATLKPAAYFSGPPVPQETAAFLELNLECAAGLRFADLALDRLRFYLHGDRQLIATLYELLFNHTLQVLVRDPDVPGKDFPITLKPADCLAPVGFELTEGLIPFPCESFVGYRLLTEFFSFPNKFTFLDLKGLHRACRAGFGKRLQVVFLLSRGEDELGRTLGPTLFQLGCTPVINLFPKVAESISLTHTRHEYKVIPDRSCRQGVEVYSVDAVSTFDPNGGKIRDYQPFYSFKFDQNRDTQKALWYASRRPSRRAKSQVTETFLVLVDRDFTPHRPAEEAVIIHTTCLNGDLPGLVLRPGHPLSLPDSSFPGEVQLMLAPTPPRRPPLRKATFLRWLAQYSLGQVPLSDADEGLDALKETLLLCADAHLGSGQKQQAAVTRQLIEGVTGLESRRVVRLVADGPRMCACRGIEFTLELDRQKYMGTGAFLFASVLERFLGLYANVNSFSQLLVRLKQGKGYLKKWPPRAADRPLA